MKRCSSCGAMLPLTAFRKRPEGRDGYRGQCRVCQQGGIDRNLTKGFAVHYRLRGFRLMHQNVKERLLKACKALKIITPKENHRMMTDAAQLHDNRLHGRKDWFNTEGKAA